MTAHNQMLKAYAQRRKHMHQMRERGHTLEEIAQVFGITRARVHQMLYPDGVGSSKWKCPVCGTKRARPPRNWKANGEGRRA